MNIYGKLIGAIIGWMITGSIFGVMLGAVIGHCFDVGRIDTWLDPKGHRRPSPKSRTNLQQLFFQTTFSIMGYIAKADGRVSQHEINYTRRVMQHLNLSAERQQIAIEQFNYGKQPDFDYRNVCQQFRRACMFSPGLLKTFLEIQMQLAYSNGQPSQETRQALYNVYSQLGISSTIFHRFEQQHRARQNYKQSGRQSAPNPKQQLKDAYTILGIESDASDAELKKAYRRAMSKNHPDRLIAKGVPADMIKLATQKTQEIKQAYELIKSRRNLA